MGVPPALPYKMHTSFSGWAAAKKLAGVDSLSEDKESTDFAHLQTIAHFSRHANH
jgi:hypothetical protein